MADRRREVAETPTPAKAAEEREQGASGVGLRSQDPSRGQGGHVLSEGQILANKYRVERLLGQGGMGSVFVAENQVLRKRVALKVMNQRFSAEPSAVQRFLREAVAASRVSHPGIVQVFDAGEHDGRPWIAMELLEGQSLGDRLDQGAMPVPEMVAMARGVLSALAAVHQEGIIHRDLKPDNIFLVRGRDGTTTAKVLDFGIAKDTSEGALNKLTATGAVVGTAYYLSPEQAKGLADIDARTDVYAMGVVLYECVSGRMPFEAETITQLIAKMFTEAPRPLREVAPHVPPPLEHVIMSCLASERTDRYPSASALLGALEDASRQVPGTDVGSMPTAYAMPVSPPPVGAPPPFGTGSPPGSGAPLHATAHLPAGYDPQTPGAHGSAPGYPPAPGPGPGSSPGGGPSGGPHAWASQPGYAGPAAHAPPGSFPGAGSYPGYSGGPAMAVPPQASQPGPGSVAYGQPAPRRRGAALVIVVVALFLLGASATGVGLFVAFAGGSAAAPAAEGPTDPTAPVEVAPPATVPGAVGATAPGEASPAEEEPPVAADPPPREAAGQASTSASPAAASPRPARVARSERAGAAPRTDEAGAGGQAGRRDSPPAEAAPAASTATRSTGSDDGAATPRQPDRAPTIRSAPATAAGPGLSSAQVRGVVTARMPLLQRECFLRASRRQPGIAGTVTLNFTIDPRGRPYNLSVGHNSTGSAYLAECTRRVIARTRFPAATNGRPTPVRYPFAYR
ncbi:MAG: TonB family protein [Sandaracinaceae bacterium]